MLRNEPGDIVAPAPCRLRRRAKAFKDHAGEGFLRRVAAGRSWGGARPGQRRSPDAVQFGPKSLVAQPGIQANPRNILMADVIEEMLAAAQAPVA